MHYIIFQRYFHKTSGNISIRQISMEMIIEICRYIYQPTNVIVIGLSCHHQHPWLMFSCMTLLFQFCISLPHIPHIFCGRYSGRIRLLCSSYSLSKTLMILFEISSVFDRKWIKNQHFTVLFQSALLVNVEISSRYLSSWIHSVWQKK